MGACGESIHRDHLYLEINLVVEGVINSKAGWGFLEGQRILVTLTLRYGESKFCLACPGNLGHWRKKH